MDAREAADVVAGEIAQSESAPGGVGASTRVRGPRHQLADPDAAGSPVAACGMAVAAGDRRLPPSVAGLAARLAPLPGAVLRVTGPAAPEPGGKRAAVLIALHGAEADLRLVFVEKAADLRAHSGQVAFPGGLIEAFDAGPVAAALREAGEETGMAPASVVPLGVLPAARTRIPRRGVDVVPVVGWWTAPGPLTPGDADEIAAVHVLRVDDLVAPANRVTWVHPSGMRGPAFAVGELFVWGLTAALLDAMFELAGWAVAWDASRESAIPARFLRGSPM